MKDIELRICSERIQTLTKAYTELGQQLGRIVDIPKTRDYQNILFLIGNLLHAERIHFEGLLKEILEVKSDEC